MKVIKHSILNYIPQRIPCEQNINYKRIYQLKSSKTNRNCVVYICERDLRLNYNFALLFGIEKSNELKIPLKIIHPKINYEIRGKDNFINSKIKDVQKSFLKKGFDFEIYEEKNIFGYLNKLTPAILIFDFNPILKRDWFKKMTCSIFEIDSHNIIPARFISNKMEYNAATLRRKIYPNISEFLIKNNEKEDKNKALDDFIQNKLPYYSEFKNDPAKNITSDLSKYLNLGFISSLEVAIKVIESNVNKENKEEFLEELIIRKELADNFCFYTKDFKNFKNIPFWAKNSLLLHKNDLRYHIYSKNDFELSNTHDVLWNACQNQLVREGKIHGYLRMYWAKKILEWTKNPTDALEIAIYLNDKYAYDAPSPAGYTNILWAIGALHDRAFQDFPVTGKIRRMTYNSIKHKFKIQNYINFYNSKGIETSLS